MGKTRHIAAVAELRPLAATGDTRPAAGLTVGELRQLMHEVALAAFAEFKAGERPEQATLSGAELAQRLGLSRTAVHRLRHEGMPALQIGEIYRYELQACLAWLRERK